MERRSDQSVLLQINECLNFSTGKIAQSIGDAAIIQGWESWIAFSAREPLCNSASHIIKVGSIFNSYTHYAENYLFDREGLSSRNATNKLIKQIKEIKPDIIQLHNIHDHWLNYELLFEYLNLTDIQVVWTFHDCWAFTGHCFHFVTKGCEKWKTECFNCPLKKEYPKTLSDRSRSNFRLKKALFSRNKNLTIVACSKWMAELVHQSFLKNKRIEIIHNGIDLDVFKPKEGKNRSCVYKVLAVSNVWNKEKGLHDILVLRKQLPLDVHITIVGLSREQHSFLPEGILGVSRTQDVDELVKLYNESDVFINPTYADTFPTVNIEALACGIPVITYRTGGSPEIVDKETGIVVEQGNIGALKDAILQLRDNPLSSEACRKRAVACFDKQKCFDNYLKLYSFLLGRNNV